MLKFQRSWVSFFIRDQKMIKNDAPLEEILAEPSTFETVKSYREKKVIPLFKKLIEDICSIKRAYHELMGYAIKINDKYEYAVETNKSLVKRNKELVRENSLLKEKADGFNFLLLLQGSIVEYTNIHHKSTTFFDKM